MARRLPIVLALLIPILGLGPRVSTGTAAASVSVVSQSASPDFPDVITFKLQASAEEEINRVELLYSLAGEEKRYLAQPEIEPSDQINLDYQLDMVTRGVPPGVEITYDWRFVDARGSTFESEPATFVWNDDRFEWSDVSSDQVTVHAYNGNESFTKEIRDAAQRTIDGLESDFELNQISPVDIWVYSSNEDYRGARLENSETWDAAVTYPELSLVLAAIPEGSHSEVGRIIPHEISHQVLHQATENPFNSPPTWLDEGLAVMNQVNGTEDDEAVVRTAAEKGRLLSLRSLNASFPFDSEEASLAYAESYSVVRFIVDHFGADEMGDLIEAYRGGISHDEAIEAALGVDLDELDQLWRESL